MKKGLIAAGLLVSLSGTAQDVSTYTPGTMGEGVVYYLPKTEIELQVTATKVVYTPGEFCQYADRYLRLTGISSQPEEHWEINSIKVNSIGIPDPDNAYAVKLKDKSAASQVELTPEGIIKAINTTSPIEKAPVTKVADTVKKRIDPRSFMTEEILIAGSTAKMAELVAKEIYNIRESKNSLTRGQADYMPKDGAALKLMLDNLDEQEQAMMQMFAGTTDRTEKSFTIRIKPEAGMKEKVAFRFSKKLGMLDADNLSGEPYYISIINQETLPPMDPKGKEKKKTDGVIYNIPAYVPQVYAIYDNLAKVLQDAGVTVSQLADKSYISNPTYVVTQAVKAAKSDAGNINYYIDVLSQFNSAGWDVLIKNHPDLTSVITKTADQARNINYFLGLNIADTPKIKSISVIIPVLSIITQYISTKLSMAGTQQQTANTDNPMGQSMQTMNTIMPFMTGFMCLMFPIGVGIYWIAGNVFRIFQQLCINLYFSKINMDDMIKENVEKAKKKYEKMGMDSSVLEKAAKTRTSNINTAAKNNAASQKSAASSDNKRKSSISDKAKKSSTKDIKKSANTNYKEGSIAAYANMLNREDK